MSTVYISVYLILFLQEIIYNHLTAARKYQTTFYFSENLKGRSFYTVLFLKIKLQLLFYILMKSKWIIKQVFLEKGLRHEIHIYKVL